MHGKVKAYTRDVHFAIERTTAARLVRQSVVYVVRLSIMLLCIDVIRLISRPAVAVPAIEIRRAATPGISRSCPVQLQAQFYCQFRNCQLNYERRQPAALVEFVSILIKFSAVGAFRGLY